MINLLGDEVLEGDCIRITGAGCKDQAGTLIRRETATPASLQISVTLVVADGTGAENIRDVERAEDV